MNVLLPEDLMLDAVTLKRGAWLFLVSWSIHTADHARRGLDATTETVVWGGTFVGLLAAVSITLIVVRHPAAPRIAAVAFPAIAVGVAASHLPPGWGVLSDPILVDSTTDGWSIVAVGLEIAASALLGATALRVLARNGYAPRINPERWIARGEVERAPAID